MAKIDETTNEESFTYDGQKFVLTQMYVKEKDARQNEYEGRTPFSFPSGQITEEMAEREAKRYEQWEKDSVQKRQNIEPEPLFTLEQ